MKIRGLIGYASLMLSLLACGHGEQKKEQWLTIDNKAAAKIQKNFPGELTILNQNDQTSLMLVSSDKIPEISEFMHEAFHRCGGFFAFEDEKQANAFYEIQQTPKLKLNNSYSLDQQDVVEPLVEQVNPDNIKNSITHLTTYNNRYYESDTGVESQSWLAEQWRQLGAGRSDFSVEVYEHSWSQPSIIGTITGTEFPEEFVIIGGHGDSVAGWSNRAQNLAPGADDNASGISTVTEVLRVLLDSDFRPKRTIKFISYAAEEVGLRGSNDIAEQFQNENKVVAGVLQLDMTNFPGSSGNIGIIRDYTNDSLSDFVTLLIDEYVDGMSWDDASCGYGCSDHASWNAKGYPAAFPFEAPYGQHNRQIHSARDTLENSDPTGIHASHFAKLGVAFAVEISK